MQKLWVQGTIPATPDAMHCAKTMGARRRLATPSVMHSEALPQRAVSRLCDQHALMPTPDCFQHHELLPLLELLPLYFSQQCSGKHTLQTPLLAMVADLVK